MLDFNDISIQRKILLSVSFIAILALSVVFIATESISRHSIRSESFNKLTAIREMKAGQIENYFSNINNQIQTLSEDLMVISATKAFKTAYHNITEEIQPDKNQLQAWDQQLTSYYDEEFLPRLQPNADEKVYRSNFMPLDQGIKILQSFFIASNPYPVGEKHRLTIPEMPGTFTEVHKQYHPIFRSYLEKFGYYDIFLIDNETGHIIYSVFKEMDFATSLLSGPYQNSGLARAFRAARNASYPNFVTLIDFEAYAPSYNAQASFTACPIFEGDQKIGVLIFQMPIDRINGIMTNDNKWSEVGLGNSGETYIIGSDYRLRNQSRFLIEDKTNYLQMIRNIGLPESTIAKIDNLNSSIGLQEVKTQGTEGALNGETGERIITDYRGVPVLSSYRPLNIPCVKWGILSEIDQTEAMEPLKRIRKSILFIVLALIPFIMLSANLVARTITKRLDHLISAAQELAAGKLDAQLDTTGQDEIGELSESFQKM